MAENSDPKAHEEALGLVEDALEKYNADKPKDAEKLIEKAEALDPSAAREIVADLDDDAGSNHTPNAS